MRWRILEISGDKDKQHLALRLNALGSLYYFSKFILKRTRLHYPLHYPIARTLESEHLHLVLEIPRDHLKTTLVTESLSMWWALPFDERDEIAMRALGYDDAWIAWMKRAHNPNTRTLIVSENEGNAIRFGKRINSHYDSNDNFRTLFPEILPDTSCTWNDTSKTQKRTASGIGEGTFDFLGVGGAVQSRHYDRIIQDDLVGREAKNSEVIMADTIEYHKLLGGVFDTETTAKELGDEVVVGNRWCYYDLNGWIRENNLTRLIPWKIETHSAEGGCCPNHPSGKPIYFTREVLEEVRARYTFEDYAHQFLNLAVLPGECPFRLEWLKYYELYEPKNRHSNYLADSMVRHEVTEGKTKGTIPATLLTRRIIVDPNHAEAKGRAHHGVIVVGYDSETDNRYLLDVWAKSTSYEELVATIFGFAKTWRLNEVYIEKIAAQTLLRFPIAEMARNKNYPMIVKNIEVSRAANSKDDGIRAMEPEFRAGKWWVRHDQTNFRDEYVSYGPMARTRDIMDCLRMSNTVIQPIRYRDVINAVSGWNQRRKREMEGTRA